jgi:hypothetical protein
VPATVASANAGTFHCARQDDARVPLQLTSLPVASCAASSANAALVAAGPTSHPCFLLPHLPPPPLPPSLPSLCFISLRHTCTAATPQWAEDQQRSAAIKPPPRNAAASLVTPGVATLKRTSPRTSPLPASQPNLSFRGAAEMSSAASSAAAAAAAAVKQLGSAVATTTAGGVAAASGAAAAAPPPPPPPPPPPSLPPVMASGGGPPPPPPPPSALGAASKKAKTATDKVG